MTLVSQIITDAFRESNLISVNDVPTTNEIAEALRLLNRNIAALTGDELGENLQQMDLGKASNIITPDQVPIFMDDLISYYVPKNTRILCNLTAAVPSLNLNPQPHDGERFAINDVLGNFATYNVTLQGNGRLIETTTSLVLSTNSFIREWFYRADLSKWMKATDLLTSDPSPFPEDFDDLLILELSMRLVPRNSQVMSQESISAYKDVKRQFTSRYRQPTEMPVEQGLIRLPSNIYTRGGVFTTRDFQRGIPIW